MTDWKLTATTIYCPDIDDEVTVIINRDGSTTCTGYNLYHKPCKETRRVLKEGSARAKRKLFCKSLQCENILTYRNGLLAEGKTRP